MRIVSPASRLILSSRRERVERNILEHIWSTAKATCFRITPDADDVKCIIRLAAEHPTSTPLVAGRHSAGVSFVPVAPPTRGMVVPKPGRARRIRLDVPFDENQTGSRTACREKEVLHLYTPEFLTLIKTLGLMQYSQQRS